jgi:L-serine dehydratase
MNYTFHSSKDLLALTQEHNKTISEITLLHEMKQSGKSKEKILKKMRRRLTVMKEAIKEGIEKEGKSMTEMSGGDARTLLSSIENQEGSDMMNSEMTSRAIAYAIATGEHNANMGQIVAFPTAGASGVIPGILLAAQKTHDYSDEKLIQGLFNAAGVGIIIAENATLAGAEGGCQAEIGSAVAMAASALTELRGGTPEQCFHAAALGLKNLLGLTCDPLGGMVEVPCIKRGGLLTSLSISASDMAIAGVESFIPFDEVVESMRNIGKMLSPKLRETALGGLAITKTGEKIKKKIGFNHNNNPNGNI